MTTGSRHAARMSIAAKMAETDVDWYRKWECRRRGGCGWPWESLVAAPCWSDDLDYRLIEPKTILINGFEVPEPVRAPLEIGTRYFLADIADTDDYSYMSWGNDDYEKIWLRLGLIHLTKEAMGAHVNALLSFTRVSDDT